MKTISHIFLLLMLATTAGAQVDIQDNTYINAADIGKYKAGPVPSDFREVFNAHNNNRENFKLLREYLNEKNALVLGLSREVSKYFYQAEELPKYDKMIAELKGIVGKKSEEAQVSVSQSLIYDYSYLLQQRNNYYPTYDARGFPVTPSFKVSEVNDIVERLDAKRKEIDKDKIIYERLKSNLETVNQDVDAVNRQIESTLAPEYKRQDFRAYISKVFAFLIGALLIIFFFIVFMKSDKNLSKELLSGNGLQFVTLFVLIIAVILFGILDILKGSELAAILAGISGYILGKGIPDKTVNATITDKRDATPGITDADNQAANQESTLPQTQIAQG